MGGSILAQAVFEPVNNLIVSEPRQNCAGGMVTGVSQTVPNDLTAPGWNCLAGFILDSDDIDDAPGGRILGLSDFTLTVTQGTPIPTLSQWGMAIWVVLLAASVILLRVLHRDA
jgi:hypothetical protein